MRAYTFTSSSDAVLVRELSAAVASERDTTATLIALIAEVDARRLYRPAGYPSMHAYCVEALHMSEDSASKRIQVARKARELPVIFAALEEGRVHLTGLRLLAPHLTPENVEELLAAATHQPKSEIELLLAHRFPRSEVMAMVAPLPVRQHAPGHVDATGPQPAGSLPEHAPGHVVPVPPQVAPVAPERFALQIMIGGGTRAKLQHAQDLLSHSVPSGDVAEVLDRALDALIARLEKRKLGATTRRLRRPRPTTDERHVPAHVRNAVWERDQGQCTFVSEDGHRCSARKFLQLDHIDPVARGGRATVEGTRLLCSAHNQYEAERIFGAGFMSEKRESARRGATDAGASAAQAVAVAVAKEEAVAEGAAVAETVAVAEAKAKMEAEARVRAVAREQAEDVFAGLRNLGLRTDKARRAAEFSATLGDVTLEERMRAALGFIRPKTPGHGRASAGTST
jgi:hypothetical protein